MANPKWNISGSLVTSTKAFMNNGGTLTNFKKAIGNVGGTITTIWEDDSESTNFWDSVGLSAAVLAKSTITHEYGSASIANVRVSGNTATFTIILTSSTTYGSGYTYKPYGPYGPSVTKNNYHFGDFKIVTPEISGYLGDTHFSTSISPVTESMITSSGGSTSSTDSTINTSGYSCSNNSISFTTDGNGNDLDFASSKTSSAVTFTINFLNRATYLTNSLSGLISSAMAVPTYKGTSTVTTGGPYPVSRTVFHYEGIYEFKLAKSCTISIPAGNDVVKSSSPAYGSIKLVDSSASTLCLLFNKAAYNVGSVSSCTVSAGTYGIQFDCYIPSGGPTGIIPWAKQV